MKLVHFFFLILSIFINLGCDPNTEAVIAQTPTNSSKTYTYLALGDSYTIGQNVDLEERWPVQLKDSLVADGIHMEDPMIIARTGWRTDNLDAAITAADLEDTTFDLVSLLIGVNNQFQGRSLSQYRIEYKALLERAIGFANHDTSKVIVLSIPDYGVTPFGAANKDKIATEIDQFNAAKKEITDSLGVKYFDITPISREAETNKSLIADDNLHPSGEMYKKWVDLIYKDVRSKFH